MIIERKIERVKYSRAFVRILDVMTMYGQSWEDVTRSCREHSVELW